MIKIPSNRSNLKKKIKRLEQGFPQDWIYIERKVAGGLLSKTDKGVKSVSRFLGRDVSEIFQQDISSVYNEKVATIRPIIGENGIGKSTLLKYRVPEALNKIEPTFNIFVYCDFKNITESPDDFWSIFVRNLIEQLTRGNSKLSELIGRIEPENRLIELRKIFKNKEIAMNIMDLISLDENKRLDAIEYFNDITDMKTASAIFNGMIELAIKHNYIVVIALDEIQDMNEIDESGTIFNLFLNIIRTIQERFKDQKLYIVVSCLENPKKQEWSEIKSKYKNFATIVRNKEIVLGRFTIEEKRAIVRQVSEKVYDDKSNRSKFYSDISTLPRFVLIHTPRLLFSCMHNTIHKIGLGDKTKYTKYEIRKKYEEEARDFMTDILKMKGFVHISQKEVKVGGYDIDIYATGNTNRTNRAKQAFGEATIMKRNAMKGKVEKFADWLLRMKGREYRPEKGDSAFFVCPKNRITEATKKVLDDNDIELYEYHSQNCENLMTPITIEVEKVEIDECNTKVGDTVNRIKVSNHKLEDIPGIGDKKAKLLMENGISSIELLLSCNSKITAKKISGVGVVSLDKWKQNARNIINV